MNILEQIPYGAENGVSRAELAQRNRKDDRQTREDVGRARECACILNLQDGRGYFRPTEEERDLVEHWVRQEEARMRTARRALKGAKRWLREHSGQTRLEG